MEDRSTLSEHVGQRHVHATPRERNDVDEVKPGGEHGDPECPQADALLQHRTRALGTRRHRSYAQRRGANGLRLTGRGVSSTNIVCDYEIAR